MCVSLRARGWVRGRPQRTSRGARAAVSEKEGEKPPPGRTNAATGAEAAGRTGARLPPRLSRGPSRRAAGERSPGDRRARKGRDRRRDGGAVRPEPERRVPYVHVGHAAGVWAAVVQHRSRRDDDGDGADDRRRKTKGCRPLRHPLVFFLCLCVSHCAFATHTRTLSVSLLYRHSLVDGSGFGSADLFSQDERERPMSLGRHWKKRSESAAKVAPLLHCASRVSRALQSARAARTAADGSARGRGAPAAADNSNNVQQCSREPRALKPLEPLKLAFGGSAAQFPLLPRLPRFLGKAGRLPRWRPGVGC